MAKATADPHDLPDPDLKIILLGDSAVGKSKLIERYLMDEYNPRQVTSSLLIIKQKARLWQLCTVIYVCFNVIPQGSKSKRR
jgi:GTPase SAR1 family protein